MENNTSEIAGDHQEPQEEARSTTTTPQAAAIRLYECSFCKKGFSNAQALGGHMNIHRKDKAKLKQASKENNQRTLNIDHGQGIPNNNNNALTPSSTSTSPPDHIGKPILEFTSSSASAQILLINCGNKLPKWQSFTTLASDDHRNIQENYSSYDHQSQMAAELKQLPLFVETASSKVSEYPSPVIQSGSGLGPESLDLELRLGRLEPAAKSSSAAMGGTRKFF